MSNPQYPASALLNEQPFSPDILPGCSQYVGEMDAPVTHQPPTFPGLGKAFLLHSFGFSFI